MSIYKDNNDGICILSFDNGGPGSYSQLLILKEIMGRMASDLQLAEDDVYPADHFDLMGGVGFGGLVALMLGHLRMNVNEAIDSLLDITSAIFPEGSHEHLDIQTNTRNLKNAVENMLQTRNMNLAARMNEDTRPPNRCRVALYAVTLAHLSHPHAFRTYPSRGSNLNPTIVEAACATMSTPQHFSPVRIGPPRRQQSFVGGALNANNPTRLLLDEAGLVFGKNRRVAQVLSLGCGLPRVISVDSSGELDINRLMKDITADCETVARDLSARLFTIDAYLRLNVDRGMEDVIMQDWDDLGAIESHTNAYLATTGVSGAVDNSLRHIKERIATIALGQLNQSSSVKVMAKKAPSVLPYFVPRKKPWDSMIHHLVILPFPRQKIFPITGMGGVWKDAVGLILLTRTPRPVIYVDASSSSSIQADLQTWVRTLGDGHERDIWEDAMRMLSNCPQGEQWALILDSADDPRLKLGPYLPKNVNITVLITSRNRDLGRLSTTHHLELGEMSSEEALEVLLKAAIRQLPLSNGELESAQTLIKELGCLAVALVQAGTYCYRLSSTVNDTLRPYTFTQYLSLFASHRADLMKKAEPGSLDSYERGAYTTLDLSYKELPQAPRDFLQLISFFHHTDIPLEAFSTIANNGFKDRRFYLPRPDHYNNTILELKRKICNSGDWNELWVQDFIQTLHSFSLLTTTSINDSVFLNLHPLIQKWSRDMDPSASIHFKAMTVQVLAASASNDNNRLSRTILPHILDTLSHAEMNDLHVNDLMSFGVILKSQGHYQKAGQVVRHALEVIEASAGAESSTTLKAYSWLGQIYMDEGKWNEAERLLETVLQKYRKIRGTEHPDTIITAGNLALAYQYRGRYGEAELLGVEVLEQRRRILGMEHPDTFLAGGNLALTYRCQERYGEAEELGVEMLEQKRRILGAEHLDTIATAGVLAEIYRYQGKGNEAENVELEILEQRKRIQGMEHPDTITAISNLASTYYSQGKWNEAQELEIQVLEQRRRILGMEHPNTILAMTNLAETRGKQGRLEEEAVLLAPAVQLNLKVLGREHPYTQRWIKELIGLYDKLGKQKEAEEMKSLLL